MPQSQPDFASSPDSVEERLRQMEERLSELLARQDRRPAAMVERVVPAEVRTHLRAAQRERLLALRAWVDVAIARVDKSPAERPRRRESVQID